MMRIAGYAAIFDAPDKGGDIIRKGAFGRAVGNGLPLLWQHDPARRIGTVESVQEDQRGLRVTAALDEPGRTVARGPILPGHGLSCGYRVRGMDQRPYRELMDLELIEISLVTHPMQPLARVIAVDNQGEDNGV